jgi:hypothetical protein
MLIIRRQPTQQEQFLYTKSAAAKLLGLKVDNIEFVYGMDGDLCLVGLYNDAVILSKVDFIKVMTNDRRARSRQVKVTQNVYKPEVFKARTNSAYNVELYKDCITCQCEDYKGQVSAFGSNQVACKHSYAVLNHLGYGSLKDYLKYQNSQGVGVSVSQLA